MLNTGLLVEGLSMLHSFTHHQMIICLGQLQCFSIHVLLNIMGKILLVEFFVNFIFFSKKLRFFRNFLAFFDFLLFVLFNNFSIFYSFWNDDLEICSGSIISYLGEKSPNDGFGAYF